MGDDIVSLSCEESECLEELLKGSEEWLGTIFESLDPWQDNTVLSIRVVWLR